MPLTAILFIFNTVFQGTKQNGKALVTIVLRKGIVDIPLMIALNLVIPIYGVVMSQPIVDVIGTIVGLILYIGYMRKEKKLLKEQELAF
jgi:O-antigen/teichoic acid export membrane protein